MADNCQNLHEYISGPATILLLAPPDDTPDDVACIDLLTDNEPERTNVLSVTLTLTPDDRLALWQREVGDTLPNRAVVITGSRKREPQTVEIDEIPEIEVDVLEDTAEPLDLGIAIARRLGEWTASEAEIRMCLHSLSALLSVFDRADVIAFVNVLNDLCKSFSAVAHHHIDPTAHDEATLAMLRPLYDTVIEYGPDGGWIVTERSASAAAPTFRSTTEPPGGTGKADPDIPETVPMPYSFQTILDMISEPRRRTLLYHLKDVPNDEISLDRLIDAVHEREQSIPVRETSSRDDVRVSLIHIDLPKLDDAGIVRYDQTTDLIQYDANPALESCLQYFETLELG